MSASAVETLPVADRVELLSLEQLVPAKDNIRRNVGDVAELAASIEAVGLLEPLVVTPREGRYLIVCGARRHAAAKLAGLDEVPCVIRSLDERGRVEAMTIENLQRSDLTPLEEAEAYRRLVELGVSQRELATRVGRSQSHVSKRLTLLELPAKVRGKLDSGGITVGDALELSRLLPYPARLSRAAAAANLQYAIDRELREAKAQEKLDAAVAKLKKAGVRILSPVKDKRYDNYELPKGAVRIEKGGSYNALTLDPAKHASEPCHAAVVFPPDGWRDGQVVLVCTDRKRHPKLKTQEESWRRSSGPQTSKARREHDKEMKGSRGTRRAFAGELLAGSRGRLPKDGAVALVVEGLAARAEAEAEKVACQLLGLEPVEVTKPYHSMDYERPLLELAAKSGTDLLRVGVALAIATEEIRLNSQWSIWDERQKAYFTLLQAHGYEPTPAEKRELAGKRPR